MHPGKTKTTEFINQIAFLAENLEAGKIFNATHETFDEKAFLQNLVSNARELIQHHEWLIALENTVENLYEVHYILDSKLVDLGIAAFKSMSSDLAMVKALEEIRKH